MSLRYLFRFVLGVALTVAVAGFARAQCTYPPCTGPGNMTSTGTGSGSYGHGAAIGIGVGAAAAVVGIALYVHHKHSMNKNAATSHASVVGCTRVGHDETTLLDETERKVYTLVAAGTDLKSGEQVELTGDRTVDSSGKRIFTVETITRNLGPCRVETALHSEPNLGKPSVLVP